MEKIKLEETPYYLEKIQSDPFFKGAYGQSLLYILHLNQLTPTNLRYKICKDVFLTIPVVIYAKKNFYLLDALNEKIDLMKAAGLIEFWSYQDVDKGFLNIKDSRQPKVLTTRHFIGCFHILVFGYIASFLIFVLEISISSINRKNFRKLIN